MTILNTTTTATTTNPEFEVNTFWIATDTQKTGMQFRPAKAFNDIDAETVLRIITNGDLNTVSKANKKGNINFTLSRKDANGINRTFGYLNNVNNALTIDSDQEAIDDTLIDVKLLLGTVELSDITRPMSANEATDLLASL